MARYFTTLNTSLITCGTGDLVGSGNTYSVAAWVNVTVNTAQSTTLVCKRDSFSVGGNQFDFNLNGLQIGLNRDNSFSGSGSANLTVGVWGHAGAVVNNATTWTSYLNGVGTANAANMLSGSGNGQTIGLGTLPVEGTEPFNGRLADAAVWNTSLTDFEMLALSRGARPWTIRPSSLVFWLPLDGLASPEPDLSGHGHNGTLSGGQPPILAFGPPFMAFTPRWPQFAPFTTAPPVTVLGLGRTGAHFIRDVSVVGY